MRIAAGSSDQRLAGQHGEQLVLSVPCYARDAQDFAGRELERDAVELHAVRVLRRVVEIAHHKPRIAELLGAIGADRADLAADHHAGERLRGLGTRIAGRDHLAAAQDGGGVAERADFLELVRDVEDRAAFLAQHTERAEQLLGLLRSQHRGGFIEDQKLRVLQQAAHDLDALPLADREPPDLALRLERQAVAARDFAHALVESGELGLVEPERDVLGDGQLLEQAEVLEHHADAARAGSGGAGEHDRLALPAEFARRSAAAGRRSSSPAWTCRRRSRRAARAPRPARSPG